MLLRFRDIMIFIQSRLPRSWIMFRIVSAVRISRTLTSFPWETCLTSPLGCFDSSVPVWTAFPSADYY
jgi:hypothetical protein